MVSRVFLVGYMGSGKSTIGRRLAADLGWHFVDTDKYIEQETSQTIPQIFASQGEEAFRQRETMALRELSARDNVVIATGGGAPCYASNMSLMLAQGLVIYIYVEPHELARRLRRSRTNRPLIAQKTDNELLDYIQLSLSQREAFYKQAQITVDGCAWPFSEYATLVRNTQ